MLNILVTGSNGQLGSCLKDIAKKYSDLNLIFKDSKTLDITNHESVQLIFQNNNIDYCINCAAFTGVDTAESEKSLATKINEYGVKALAEICAIHKSILIHISTDFVFDGKKSLAYTETDITNPIGVYGLTKHKGEIAVKNSLMQYFIIRTSWLYSEYNQNFLKTMLTLSKTRKEINVVDDQIGTPTYAKDLAETIFHIINTKNKNYGTYHYSNEGVASWYDFAKAIFEESKSDIKLLPIKADQYPTPAKRPFFSVLDKTKIKSKMNIEIPYWRDSLKRAIFNTINFKE